MKKKELAGKSGGLSNQHNYSTHLKVVRINTLTENGLRVADDWYCDIVPVLTELADLLLQSLSGYIYI